MEAASVGGLIILDFGVRCMRDVRYWPLADIDECAAHVRFWGQSRHAFLREVAFAVAIGGRADMTCCGAYVCL